MKENKNQCVCVCLYLLCLFRSIGVGLLLPTDVVCSLFHSNILFFIIKFGLCRLYLHIELYHRHSHSQCFARFDAARRSTLSIHIYVECNVHKILRICKPKNFQLKNSLVQFDYQLLLRVFRQLFVLLFSSFCATLSN